jgi:hypothetical protein
LRSGSFGLPRLLPGLTTDSAHAGRGGPSRSSAPRRRFIGITACEPSTHSSAPLRSTFLLPGPAHAGLLSWGRTGHSGLPERLAPRPSVSFAPSLEGPSRVHSQRQIEIHRIRPSDANPKVSFRPRGISPPRRLSPRDDSQACCILQPTMGFATFHLDQPKLTTILATRPPLEGISHLPVVLRSPGALAPVAFALADSESGLPLLVDRRGSFRGRHLRGIVRADGL